MPDNYEGFTTIESNGGFAMVSKLNDPHSDRVTNATMAILHWKKKNRATRENE
ncbi:MAG: hypothetical protein UX44_C0033G0007 [candidate division WWE3 bacterium GW2011_GWA1_46_21]|uniref:Uncharacterized protein n=1 Tax=candidate division WWE3 bacterium GW2011_GWA1_46_21 TaxID=1619107 RepID=A0A0G1PAH7_UNCKA|nr:MAG: hypothetical protein UX44_C0033G0007 [candidate division WWE3 bacterium GW2011_GWA1_46_21]